MRQTVSLLECIERIPSLLKSIFENRHILQKEMFEYLAEDGLQNLSRIILIGSGTSSTSGTTAAYFANKVAGVPVTAVIPSEFCHNTYHYDPNALYVFISQTGTSKLTQQAMDLVQAKGYKNICVSESKDTPMAKSAACFLDMGCGYEEYPMRTIGYSTTVFTLQIKAWETPKMTSVGLELEEGLHGANYGYNHNHCVIVFNDGGIDSLKALSLSRYMREVFSNGLAIGAEVVCEDDLKLELCGENFCCLQFAAVGQTITYKLALDQGRDLPAPHDNSIMYSYFTTHKE